jgi:hypothetical protein
VYLWWRSQSESVSFLGATHRLQKIGKVLDKATKQGSHISEERRDRDQRTDFLRITSAICVRTVHLQACMRNAGFCARRRKICKAVKPQKQNGPCDAYVSINEPPSSANLFKMPKDSSFPIVGIPHPLDAPVSSENVIWSRVE